jgi:hypothetical protein
MAPYRLVQIYRSFGKTHLLLFYPAAGSNRILLNATGLIPDYTASNPTKSDVTELKYTVDVQKKVSYHDK